MQGAVTLQRLCNRRCSFCTNVVRANAVPHRGEQQQQQQQQQQQRNTRGWWVGLSSVSKGEKISVHNDGVVEVLGAIHNVWQDGGRSQSFGCNKHASNAQICVNVLLPFCQPTHPHRKTERQTDTDRRRHTLKTVLTQAPAVCYCSLAPAQLPMPHLRQCLHHGGCSRHHEESRKQKKIVRPGGLIGCSGERDTLTTTS